MSSVRLVAIDLDGTLLGSDLTISDCNRAAIFEAERRGVVVVVATGRMFRSAQALVGDLIQDVPMVVYNGALIRTNLSGSTLLSLPIPPDVGEPVVRFLWDWGVAFQAYFNDELWVPRRFAATQRYSERYGVDVHVLSDIDEFVRHESMKYLVLEEPDRIQAVRTALEPIVGSEVRVMGSLPSLLEIVNAKASKAAAIRYLASRFHIDMSDTMAIGDGENDIEMIQAVGCGVAVGNAQDIVKAQADYVVGSNDCDGVAEAFERFVFA